jgi:phage tail-like protein
VADSGETRKLPRGGRPTQATQAVTAPVDRSAPASASARGYLRSGLPAIYHDRLQTGNGSAGLGMRFVAALEQGLDPVVTTLDCLPAYLEADLAPPDVLDMMAGWLGLEPDETLALERRRELVRRSAELGRRRGTRAGLELALQVVFPELPLRVEDGGGVVVAASVDDLPEPPAPAFVVYCDRAIPVETQVAIVRLIEQHRPANVGYRLRVKAPKPRTDEAAP